MDGQHLEHFGVEIAQGAQGGFNRVSLGIGFGLGVFGLGGHQLGPVLLELDLPGEFRFADLLLLGFHRQIGVDLRLADLALFLFDGDFGAEFVLFNDPLLFHS